MDTFKLSLGSCASRQCTHMPVEPVNQNSCSVLLLYSCLQHLIAMHAHVGYHRGISPSTAMMQHGKDPLVRCCEEASRLKPCIFSKLQHESLDAGYTCLPLEVHTIIEQRLGCFISGPLLSTPICVLLMLVTGLSLRFPLGLQAAQAVDLSGHQSYDLTVTSSTNNSSCPSVAGLFGAEQPDQAEIHTDAAIYLQSQLAKFSQMRINISSHDLPAEKTLPVQCILQHVGL